MKEVIEYVVVAKNCARQVMLPAWMIATCQRGSCLVGFFSRNLHMERSSDGGTKWGKT